MLTSVLSLNFCRVAAYFCFHLSISLNTVEIVDSDGHWTMQNRLLHQHVVTIKAKHTLFLKTITQIVFEQVHFYFKADSMKFLQVYSIFDDSVTHSKHGWVVRQQVYHPLSHSVKWKIRYKLFLIWQKML